MGNNFTWFWYIFSFNNLLYNLDLQLLKQKCVKLLFCTLILLYVLMDYFSYDTISPPLIHLLHTPGNIKCIYLFSFFWLELIVFTSKKEKREWMLKTSNWLCNKRCRRLAYQAESQLWICAFRINQYLNIKWYRVLIFESILKHFLKYTQ